MKHLLILFFAFLFFHGKPANACGNEYFNTSNNLPLENKKLLLNRLLQIPDDTNRPYWWNGFGDNIAASRDSLLKKMGALAGLYPESLNSKLDFITGKLISTSHFKLLSDYAWHEVRVGDRDRALKLMEALYQKYPSEYTVLSNLGTAYEITGNDSLALVILRKAMDVNPGSHYNSEWIHIKILEQKLSAKPVYSDIINLAVGDFANWLANDRYEFPQPADSLKNQIAYQLHERISFIKAPDPIVAQLILDFADIVAKHDGTDPAIPFYDYAASYGNQEMKDKVRVRKDTLTQTKKEIEGTFRKAAIIWAIPLVALVLIFIAWLRSMRRQRKENSPMV